MLAKRLTVLFLTILLGIVAVGCGRESKDALIVGEWAGEFVQATGKKLPGASITFNADHTFREVYGNLVVEGSWTSEGSSLSLQPKTLNGKPVAEAKKLLIEASKTAQQKEFAANLERPIPLTLEPDGKTLTADKLAAGQAVYRKQ